LYLDILSTLREGVSGPTLITGEVRISWGLLKDVLCDLVSVGLIECRINNAGNGKRSYYITSKGKEFLHIFENKEIRELLKSVNVTAS